MTHKNLVKQLDGLVATICERKGLNPAIGVKGGQAEIAHSLLGLALTGLTEQLLAAAGAPAPAVAPAAPAAAEAA